MFPVREALRTFLFCCGFAGVLFASGREGGEGGAWGGSGAHAGVLMEVEGLGLGVAAFSYHELHLNLVLYHYMITEIYENI